MSKEAMAFRLAPSRTNRFGAQFQKISCLQSLDCDPRPSFVLDLEKLGEADHFADGFLAHCNPALTRCTRLSKVVLQIGSVAPEEEGQEAEAFREWLLHSCHHPDTDAFKVFLETLWTVVLLPGSWALISGVELSQGDLKGHEGSSALRDIDLPVEDLQIQEAAQTASLSGGDEAGVWPPLKLGDSEHIAWIRRFDWASTPLGPTSTWPSQLKQACQIAFANPDPVTIFWGPELILIYNEAYVALTGNKHPAMMGGSARVHWAEVWHMYDPLFDQVILDGQAFSQDNTRLLVNRNGYLEEGFFNLRVMPVLGESGQVEGFYEPVTEVTKQTLTERRMHMLLNLSERLQPATSLEELWRRLLDTLKGHPNDVHFAALYNLRRKRDADLDTWYDLEGLVGSEISTKDFRPVLNMSGAVTDDLVASFHRAHEAGRSVLHRPVDGSFPTKPTLQVESLQNAPGVCIVCPLSQTADADTEAFLVLGTSPLRTYDEDYELFVSLLVRQIESNITFVKLLESERELLRQQAIYDSEAKFKRFAENAQVGIFNFDPKGKVTFCNEAWLELSGHDRGDWSAMSWTKDVHPDNIGEIAAYWDKIVNLEGPQTFEVQYKKPWKPKNLNDDSISLDRTWVVASAYAEVDEAGQLSAILGCITDVSSFKWVDQLQSQRLSEALELKRQQENFLDITSHEMRNPLNAILHCAAELIDLLPDISQSVTGAKQAEALRDCQEAARTIVYCGRHQKRIIDDVLTLSKLDSNLLSISPIEARPVAVVAEVLKVFDTETRAAGIKTEARLADSFKRLKMDALLFDPHRVSQILINLIANAVKFMKGEANRSLHVIVEAHDIAPQSSEDGVRYVPSGRRPSDPTVQAEWGTGDVVFLQFSVQDTGPGMSREEADLLFNRFAQGSPRTHVQYGGSGLGLFISRELAELHGGRIGISSQLGRGSTFDFYIKARRSTLIEPVRPSLMNAASIVSATQVPKAALSAKPAALAARRAARPSIKRAKLHLLIVEDNLINQKILAKLMRKQGWEVSVANHGEEALAVINDSTWRRALEASSQGDLPKLDIVLADIEMPVMDGKEFVRHVRRLQSEGILSPDIPVVAVTGNARVEQMEQAKECGFDEVVSKPYREDQILSVVFEYTERAGA